jgi:hypothetical protein
VGREHDFVAVYEGVSKSFRTGRLDRMVQLSATRCSCIAILLVCLMEFCRHNSLCCFSTSVCCCKRVFRYRLSPETFEYTLVYEDDDDDGDEVQS